MEWRIWGPGFGVLRWGGECQEVVFEFDRTWLIEHMFSDRHERRANERMSTFRSSDSHACVVPYTLYKPETLKPTVP